MVYGLARVSSRKQSIDGNSLESQEKTILERYPGCEIVKEVYSGAKKDRKVFLELINKLEEGDLLVVTKLDRFCRSTEEGLRYIEILIERGVSVHILNMGLIDNTPTGKLIVTIFLAFAEFERAMIIERTSDGKEIARLRPDYREGRPSKFSKAQVELALTLLKDNSYKQVYEMTGISVSTLHRARRKQETKLIGG